MKRKFALLILFHLVLSGFAKSASLFDYDATRVEKVLVSVNVLDDYVSRKKISVNDLHSDNPLLKNFSFPSAFPSSKHPFLGIPSFCWGLFLGWVGILIVYLVSEDKDETRKALYGCIVGSVLGIACFIFLGGYVVDFMAKAILETIAGSIIWI